MKHHPVAQGSFHWHRHRIGMPTASSFHKVMMGAQTQTRRDYMCRLVMERILNRSLDEGLQTKWMAHGVATESEAVAEFCRATNLMVEPCGFITNGRYGCSPDRLIGDSALLEIKCPAPWTHCRYHVYGPGDDYKAQVQGQMLVTERSAVYFWSYFPGLPPFRLETRYDEKYVKKLKTELGNFCDELDEKTEYMKKLGTPDMAVIIPLLAKLMPEVYE